MQISWEPIYQNTFTCEFMYEFCDFAELNDKRSLDNMEFNNRNNPTFAAPKYYFFVVVPPL